MSNELRDEAIELEDHRIAEVGSDAFAKQRQRAAERGGFLVELNHHIITWLPNRGDRLVISFDNLAAVRETVDRTIWGQQFLLDKGYDVLGLQIKRRDWYRDRQLISTLQDMRDDGFFRRFSAISTYGSSMGGFAALAFAPLVPGCTVMAFAPQRSLDLAVCPFETRYRYARLNTDWSLPFGDAAEGVRAAAHAYIAFDPMMLEDSRHAAALAAPNVTFLPMRHMGHKLPPRLMKMGLMKIISQLALEARLDVAKFYRLMRVRRDCIVWRADFLERCKKHGHFRLGLAIAEKMMVDRPHWKIRHKKKELAAAFAASNNISNFNSRVFGA
jgi:hypothetical protein